MTEFQKPPARRRFLVAAARAACVGLVPAVASAQQAWPQKPIRLVVPYAPGGSADLLGRLIGKHLNEVFKQPVVIENKGGAGGTIASLAVARTAPDGYNLVVSGIGSHVIAPVEARSFDPLKDFTHIAMLGGPPLALVINAQEPVQDFQALRGYITAQPQGVSWASPGQGTHGHLTGELFHAATRLNMTHISYKGAGAAMTDLLGNTVPLAFMTLSSATEYIRTGRLRLLALSSRKRLQEYPGVPTFAELGYPNLTGTTWFGLAGPAGMLPAVVEKLNVEVRRALQTPAVKAQLAVQSMETADYDAAAYRQFVADEIARWTPAARSALAAAR